jgi:hypothetical protein
VKALAALEALLWAFHNAKSGLCFPSYEKIAEAAPPAASGPPLRAERGIRGRDRKNLTTVWREKAEDWQAITGMAQRRRYILRQSSLTRSSAIR